MNNKTPISIKNTLTTALLQSGVNVISQLSNASYSNARYVPYVERYQASNAIMEEPIEVIQRAAEDEARRKGSRFPRSEDEVVVSP